MLQFHSMKLSELGEFRVIDLIHKIANKFGDPQQLSQRRLLLGIGDDTAAWQGDCHIQLATTDTLVQDVHFHLNTITWEELGWKSLAVNLSDIAAMGGFPQYALISLTLPADLSSQYISAFYEGMASLAAKFGVSIAGGNLSSAPYVVITVTVIGYSEHDELLRRSTAKAGEQIAVTGHLGLAKAALEVLKNNIKLPTETIELFRQRQFRPIPRISEGQILLNHGVKTAIDISDGLVADLKHICKASKVNAKVFMDRIPIHPLLKANFTEYKKLALYGGEDYELLFTANKEIIQRLKRVLDCPITVIGDIVKEGLPTQVVLLDNKGRIAPCEGNGWDHFRDVRLTHEIT